MRPLSNRAARLAVLTLATTLQLTCSAPAPSAEEPGSPVGKPVPAFELAALDGSKVSATGLAGKTVLLDFWATWCKPCHEQTRILTPLYQELKGQGIEFLAINSGEDEETVRRFVAKSPFAYPVLLDPQDSLSPKLDVLALPTVVVIDRKGKVTFIQEGVAEAAEVRKQLEKAGK